MKTKGNAHAHAKIFFALTLTSILHASTVFGQLPNSNNRFVRFENMGSSGESEFHDYLAFSKPSERLPFRLISGTVGIRNFSITEEIVESEEAYPSKNSREITADEILLQGNLEDYDISFQPTSFTYPANSKSDIGIPDYSGAQILLYAGVLKQFAKQNGYDTNYAFLSNMGMRSNRKRFFVVDLSNMVIMQSGLVSHGRGQGPSIFDRQYSNINGSRCTSLGRYKITGKYKGGYGESYRMVGLDSSNANAFSRNIVLHSMECIPDKPGVMPACVSEGCPAVSTSFFSSLGKIIDSRKKPVLLWIFDSNLEKTVIKEKFTESEYANENQPGKDAHQCSIHHFSNEDSHF